MSTEYVKAEHVSLESSSELNEKWVQDIIAKDPNILGLGDLVLRDQERRQPRAGRLDLLLQDQEADPPRRYEVELQLGSSDESHIIRTIEYWDIERRRYPQYDHCAVLIAEDITSRFFNVIALLNGAVPLIAIQMQALKINGNMTLSFIKVMDELNRGLVDEDEEAETAPADRTYWVNRATESTVALADKFLDIAKEIDPSMALKYTKYYIGVSSNRQFFNFVLLRPRKSFIILDVPLPKTETWSQLIENEGMDIEYARGKYRFRFTERDIAEKIEFLRNIMRQAYNLKPSYGTAD